MIQKTDFEAWLQSFEELKQDNILLGRAFIEKFLTHTDNQLSCMQCDNEALNIIRQFYIDDSRSALGNYQ